VFLSNYEIPAGYKGKDMTLTPALTEMFKKAQAEEAKKPKTDKPAPVEELPQRTGIVYHDNAGYDLTVDNLPWGKAGFTVKRYRLSKTENLELVEQTTGSGGSLKLSKPFAPDTVELIVLKRR